MPIIGIIDSQKSGHLGGSPIVGAYDALATYTVLSGGTSAIMFSGIPSTYTDLEIRAILKDTNTGADSQGLLMQYNGDSGANYSFHRLTGDGSSASAGSGTSQTSITVGGIIRSSSSASMFSSFIMTIKDYSNTSKNKTNRQILGWDTNNTTTGSIGEWSGAWYSTAAINSITFTIAGSESFAQYSSISLYGVR